MVRYYPYSLELRSPVLLPALDGDPNSAFSLSWVPGGALRGAIARALGDPSHGDCAPDEFQRLVLDGTVTYLNAYPELNGQRTLPAPVSFRKDKDELDDARGSLRAVDLSAPERTVPAFQDPDGDSDDDIDDEPEDMWASKRPVDPASRAEARSRLENVSAPFVTLAASRLQRVGVKRSGRLHQQRDRTRGRAWKDKDEVAHGAVYVYESLDACQRFRGLLRIHGEDLSEIEQYFQAVREHLQDVLVLGRSRRAGYGGDAALTWDAPVEQEVRGPRVRNQDITTGTRFRVVLTSAYLGRNQQTGQPDPAWLEDELLAGLGHRAEVKCRCVRFESVGGYNRKWGLELPQVSAAAAGSVLILQASEDIPAADLRRLEHAGLGERRGEGFGRLVFLEAPERVPTLHPASPPSQLAAPTGPVPEVVRLAEGRLLEAQLQRRLELTVASFAGSACHRPTNSLLGRLRTPLRGNPREALKTLQAWLGHEATGLRRPAREQLERCRVNSQGSSTSLRKWLIDAAHSLDLSRLLNYDLISQRYHLASPESARAWLAGQEAEVRVRLIDGLLETLIRINKLAEGGPEHDGS